MPGNQYGLKSWRLDHRSQEPLMSRNHDRLDSWAPEIKNSGTQEFLISGLQEVLKSGAQSLLKSWIHGFLISWPQEPLTSCFPEFMIPWVTDLLSPWSIGVCRELYIEGAVVLGLLPPSLSDWQSPSSVRPKAKCQIFFLARQRNVFQYAIWTLTGANLCHSDANHCHRTRMVEKTPPLPLYSLSKP